MWNPHRLVRGATAGAALIILACSGGDEGGPVQGSEGGSCYPNGTCNPGLTCASNLCVEMSGGCTEGETLTCACSDGSESIQRCTAERRLTPCACGAGGAGGAATGGTGAVGGAGAGGMTPVTGGAGGTLPTTGGAGGIPATGGTGGSGGAGGGCGAALCGTWSECFGQAFFYPPENNCNDFCAARGQVCTACGEYEEFMRGWNLDPVVSCEANPGPGDAQDGPGDCSRDFGFGSRAPDDDPFTAFRCCCATP